MSKVAEQEKYEDWDEGIDKIDETMQDLSDIGVGMTSEE